MRAALLLLVLFGLGAVGILLFRGAAAPASPSRGRDIGGRAATMQPAAALPAGVVATRAEAVDIDPGALADRPTVCLRVIDHSNEQPISGAAVRRLLTGADLSFSDDRGVALVALEDPAQLSVVAEGYLLRLAPARPGSDEQDPQVVRLVRDTWSNVRRFAFVDPDGAPVEDVFVRLRDAAGAQPVDNGRLATMEPVARRAWSEHLMMASRAVSRDQHVHAGAADEHVYRHSGEVLVVRFVASAEYVLEATTPAGLVAAAKVRVSAGAEPPVQVVKMVAGGFISGVVRDTSGAALADAMVTLQGGDPLGLAATSGADGSFTIGPLLRRPSTLLVRHGVHKPIAVEGVLVPSEGQQLRLEPLSRTPLRGRVRARPGLQPIRGATVIWQVAGGGAITSQTGDDGTFELQAAGDVAARLVIQAPRFITYAELVDPGAPFTEYDLLPAVPALRVARGLTATLEGVVFTASALPLAGVSVRWRPSTAPVNPGLPGRRVLEGAALDLPDVIKTGADGAFVLETSRFGPGVLTVSGARPITLSVTAVAGQRRQGIELRR